MSFSIFFFTKDGGPSIYPDKSNIKFYEKDIENVNIK